MTPFDFEFPYTSQRMPLLARNAVASAALEEFEDPQMRSRISSLAERASRGDRAAEEIERKRHITRAYAGHAAQTDAARHPV